MSVDAVVFDWGGTLSVYANIDLADMWDLAADHLAAETGRDRDEIARCLSESEAEYWRGVDEHQTAGTLADVITTASKKVGLDVADAVVEAAALRHLDSWTPHVRHHPDASPALAALRDRGIKTGLLSNTHWPRAFHEQFLERDGLADLLDVRCYTSELSHSKPHPAAFAHVLTALDVDASRAVFVGDRPIDDIGGAKGAGMRAVLRPNPDVPSAKGVVPDATIETLHDLIAIVDRWRV